MAVGGWIGLVGAVILHSADLGNARGPKGQGDLDYWVQNMVEYHRFSVEEAQAATGVSAEEIREAMERVKGSKPLGATNRVLVLPYPGGRHPRIGFLEGAVDPQRETKLSIFLPWDAASYVVADVPEAIWSNLGLTYLAHTHVPTIWSEQGIELPRLEWERLPGGEYRMERTLPNGIRFGTHTRPGTNVVLMKMWLSNGTERALSDLRVQNCVMLKGAQGFNALSNTNKVFRGPFAACRSEEGDRWIIQAWQPLHRTWGNEPVPCLHSDPRFPDAAPGETQTIYGLVSFFTGKDIEGEFDRLERAWTAMAGW